METNKTTISNGVHNSHTKDNAVNIGKVIAVLLHKLNVPDEEVYDITDQIYKEAIQYDVR